MFYYLANQRLKSDLKIRQDTILYTYLRKSQNRNSCGTGEKLFTTNTDFSKDKILFYMCVLNIPHIYLWQGCH